MKKMDFSAFVKMLYGYRKQKKKYKKRIGHAEFIKIITDAAISQDKLEAENISENPIYSYEDRMLQYIFNGEKSISSDIAAPMRRVMDDVTFTEYFEDFSMTALEALSHDLAEYGFEVQPYQVPQACGNILIQLIEHIAEELPEDVTKLDYVARGQGRRVKDIPPTSISLEGDHLHIAGETITVDMRKLTDREADEAMHYVQALYEAYASALGRDHIGSEDIDSLPQRIRKNYKQQNEAFFYAEAVQHKVRELFDDGEEEFSKLKKDELTFIDNTYWKKYDNGFERLVAVLDRAMETDLSASCLANIRNLINNLAKMGICHIMVEDGDIKSWVIDDEEE